MPRVPKGEGCTRCTGYSWPGSFIEPEGYGKSGLLIVGEAGGKSEGSDGLPFRPYAISGSLLERAFRDLGTSRSHHRLTNILHCSPPHDWLVDAPYEFDVIQSCRPYLDHEIESMQPRCILALGGVALRELTGFSGKYQGVSYMRGYVLALGREARVPVPAHDCVGEGCFSCDGHGTESRMVPTDTPVIATFHPAFIRRGSEENAVEGRKGNMRLYGVLLHDLKLALEIARVGAPERKPTRYQPHPSLDDVLAFEHRCQGELAALLTYDIETPDSADMDEDERDEDQSPTITQIQFSLGVGEGIVLTPDIPNWLDIARRIVALPHQKAGHNVWSFDDPKMRANGFHFGGPLSHDTMVMFHHIQPDLPQNLQFAASFCGMDFPWKHFSGADMGEYGCGDVDAPQRMMAYLPAQLRARGLWEGYYRRTYQVRPLLADVESRGLPINDVKRRAFGEKLDAAKEVEWGKMQALVPEECRNVHPKQGYKKTPKDTTGMVERKFPLKLEGSYDGDQQYATRWCRIEPFTPSPQQLIRYMKFKGHPVPKDIKRGRDTTAAKELERLEVKTGDLLYRHVRTYREIQTMKGTFVDGWKPASDGRIHTTFTFKPATAQLSSRGPNIQNGPQHVGLASEFNEIIEAPDGYTLVDFDHKSFHALTLGILAGDEVYTRLARIDIHSFVTSEFLHLKPASTLLAMQDAELAEYLGWVKKTHEHTRNYKIKRVILGWQYGRRYKAIYHAYREDFTGETEAKRMEETLEGCFPKAVQFRTATLHEADRAHFLSTTFGFTRWFWDVLDYRPPKGGKSVRKCSYCGQHHSNGGQAEQAIAYRPACCAFGMMREEALDMHERGTDARFGLVNNIHDAWKFCTPTPLVEECLHTVKPLMETPSPYMTHPVLAPDGLVCEVECKVGRNARFMETVKVKVKVKVEVNLPKEASPCPATSNPSTQKAAVSGSVTSPPTPGPSTPPNS